MAVDGRGSGVTRLGPKRSLLVGRGKQQSTTTTAGGAFGAAQGDTSPQTDPGRYLQSVLALHARYLALAGGACSAPADSAGGSAGSPMPLVVNTHGWISGVGLDLVAEMLRCIQPTDGEAAGGCTRCICRGCLEATSAGCACASACGGRGRPAHGVGQQGCPPGRSCAWRSRPVQAAPTAVVCGCACMRASPC